jgi:hypothetical protein
MCESFSLFPFFFFLLTFLLLPPRNSLSDTYPPPPSNKIAYSMPCLSLPWMSKLVFNNRTFSDHQSTNFLTRKTPEFQQSCIHLLAKENPQPLSPDSQWTMPCRGNRIKIFLRSCFRAAHRTPRVEVFAAKSGELSSIPGLTWWAERIDS